jgi:peptide deformylase
MVILTVTSGDRTIAPSAGARGASSESNANLLKVSTNSPNVTASPMMFSRRVHAAFVCMYEELKIINYPDPRLKKVSKPIDSIDESTKALAARMLELMREHRGVGLAAPQVGLNLRMFVMNHTGEPTDDRVYVNPQLLDAEGSEEAEEGCLSLPGLNANVVRDKTVRIVATDLEGKPIDEKASGYLARVWQHEFDHLNGTLIIDRMGPVAKIAAKKRLRELEDEFQAQKK